jgi:2-amino-4-hydroxy-6-hydroxymethyldihydropteridine diphosphokinase
MRTSYAVALGSNMRSPRHGSPARVVDAAFKALDIQPLSITARSSIVQSRPIGPSQRAYANAAALVETDLDPAAFLEHLKALERSFGRRDRGQRWRARPLDLDIILWSGGAWAGDVLIIPHPAFRARSFVLSPLSEIARDWRDPVTNRTIGQLAATLPKSSAF